MFTAAVTCPQGHSHAGVRADRGRLLAKADTAKPARSAAQQAIQDAQRAWLAEVVQQTGLSPTQLARRVGVSDTTLSRFLNNVDYRGVLNPLTVQQISEFAGVAGPGAALAPDTTGSVRSFREEGRPFLAEPGDPRQRAVEALIGGRKSAFAWVMRTDILALAGVRSGDVLIVDQAVPAHDGDVVCAQIERGLGATTVFRIYQAPNLVAAAFDALAARPEPVDGRRVRIAGVMTDLVRGRT